MKCIISVEYVHKLLSDDEGLLSIIYNLIAQSISSKKNTFLKGDYHAFLARPDSHQYVKDVSGDQFMLNYRSLVVNEVLLRKACDTLRNPIPNDPLSALKFTNEFCEQIRMPKTNHYWYGQLESGLEGYALIYLNQMLKVNVTAFLKTITDEMRENEASLRVFENNYVEAFPFLHDSIEVSFSTLQYFYEKESLRHFAVTAADNLGEYNEDRALEMYEYALQNDALKYDRLLSTLLIRLYSTDPARFLSEAKKLFFHNPLQGLTALAFFSYKHSNEVEQAFAFVEDNRVDNTNFEKLLVDFYARILENSFTPVHIKSQCFTGLRRIFKESQDQQVKAHLISRLSIIEGFDEEKFDLLPEFMASGIHGILNRFFNHFKSPKYLFALIKDAFLHHGVGVRIDQFREAISWQFDRSFESSEDLLLEMLSDNLAIVRHAGMQILTSNHGDVYKVKFLKLNEEGQRRVIETVLLQPHGIEELLPTILELRNSPYSDIRDQLGRQLVSLIWAYDKHLVDLVEPHLSVCEEHDQNLLKRLKDGFEEYSNEKDVRNAINEFNPVENELPMLELYYRLESEMNAEMVERASSNSIFSQLAKTTNVIRGNAFKSEENPTINRLATVSTSRLVDQRYYMDPEHYEWIFQMKVYGENYTH